jgi:lipid II:glycine glycyltransferase (peptidoglycan interpeptide bridge formation enzyme)
MKAKTRYNIRLAERKGVTVRTGGVDDFEMVADMYAETGERNAFAIRPRAYYLDVWRTFATANMLHILIAEYDAQPLAALLIVYHGPLALYMYGASSEQERNRMPTYLLQWEALRWAQSRGCTQYDMWGAPDHFVEEDRMWGVWRFKRGFNGTVTRHIGAWDFAVYPHLYQLYTEAMPRYLAWLRSR